jgi:hypothetical protein
MKIIIITILIALFSTFIGVQLESKLNRPKTEETSK